MSELTCLKLTDVSKRYGGTAALNRVHFEARRGSIHAILGENGAGKSTLIKILAGVVKPDEGRIDLDGNAYDVDSPADATALGVVTIFQELSLVPHLSVADNICLADPPRTRLGFLDRAEQRKRAMEAFNLIGCDPINPDLLCRDIPLAKRQLVEIAKAAIRSPKVLVLDEATSALTTNDVQHVLDFLVRLRRAGTTILYISHRMREIEQVADRCSVFRNGNHVETFDAGSKSDDEILGLMIGRPISQVYPVKPPAVAGARLLVETEGLGWNGRLNDISIKVHAGEIVGLGGLDGQGQKELMLALFGVLNKLQGTIRYGDTTRPPASPLAAKQRPYRIALIPEDRKTEGLFLDLSVADNISCGNDEKFSRLGLVARPKISAAIELLISELRIKFGDLSDPIASLSGGNQQKAILARCLVGEPELLLLIDPTRGIDVGTKQQIFALLRKLAGNGMGVLFYSTDYDELIGLCDVVHVLREGRVTGTLTGSELTEARILGAAMSSDACQEKIAC